jgi:uncharacterized LabA/DUF88 family protein
MNHRVDRAVFFVDGSNFYHGCEELRLSSLGRLNFAKVCAKLVGPRQWIATRYYVGRVPPTGNLALSADQKKFLGFLTSCDPRISVHLGRIEPRPAKSAAAQELGRYLANLRVRIDRSVYRDLVAISQRYAMTSVMVEKAVDVKIAVDMVVMAGRGEYDTAYLLSADGDLTPAVEAARATGRKVFVASAQSGAQLAAACDKFLPLRREWFDGLFAF